MLQDSDQFARIYLLVVSIESNSKRESPLFLRINVNFILHTLCFPIKVLWWNLAYKLGCCETEFSLVEKKLVLKWVLHVSFEMFVLLSQVNPSFSLIILILVKVAILDDSDQFQVFESRTP